MNERKGILIVDDTLAALKLLADILIQEGYTVRPASGGEQALTSVFTELPELILLDVKMPGIDGFEVCKRLKARPESREIPILFLSASTDTEERVKGFELGGNDFISKPFQRDELLARVRAHLELSRLRTRLEFLVEKRTEELRAAYRKLQDELLERQKAESALIIEKKTTDAILESVPGLLYMYNENGRLIRWNKKHFEITGYSNEELLNIHYLDWFDEDEKSIISKAVEKMMNEGYASTEANLKIKNGFKIPFLLTAVPLEIDSLKYMLGIGINITELKEAEKRIKISLNEKDILIKELYHRTKNNMQVICSMLKYHTLYSSDEKVNQVFNEMENRIYAMSLVHQKLYQSKNLSSIYFCNYIKELCELLKKSYKVSDDKIVFNLNIGEFSVIIDIAVPCGLIINELISNSLKYAFARSNKGEINISMQRNENGDITILYSDNGKGMPENFDFEKDARFGMKTIFSIVRHQLQGAVFFESDNGTRYSIKFQDKHYTSRI